MTQPATSYRLSEHTTRQINELAQHMGTTATTVVTIAIDRLHRDLYAAPGEYNAVPVEYPVATANQ